MKSFKKYFLIVVTGFFILIGTILKVDEIKAQSVGINTESIPPDAVLNIYSSPSNPKGVVFPKLTTDQRNNINPSTVGLTIYNSTTGRYEMWKSTGWTGLDGGLWNPGPNNNAWRTTGFVGIGTTTPSARLHVYSDGDRVLHLQRSGAFGSQITFENKDHIINFGLDSKGGFGFAKSGDPYGKMLGVEKDKPGEIQVNGQVGGIIPKGGIIMWSGSPNAIPEGWALCDGTNGRPDLRGQFVVGYHPKINDYNGIGKTGGKDSVKLLAKNLPRHTHTYSGTTKSAGAHSHTTDIGKNCCSADGGYYLWTGGFAGSSSYKSSQAGEHSHTYSGRTAENQSIEEAHENRPSFFVLAYIIKL